jgi:peptide/nickel transport system ATP-binding protein
MIAMALSCEPKLLIAAEPTTALDVTIQGQILDLIADLVDETGMALILISHDLGVIAETVDRVMVMYGGAGVEAGPTASVFRRLAHPYTQGLFAAVPKLGGGRGGGGGTARRTRLTTIPGTVPELIDLPQGCTFADRCPIVGDDCAATTPIGEFVAESGAKSVAGSGAKSGAGSGADHWAACLKLDEALKGDVFAGAAS